MQGSHKLVNLVKEQEFVGKVMIAYEDNVRQGIKSVEGI